MTERNEDRGDRKVSETGRASGLFVLFPRTGDRRLATPGSSSDPKSRSCACLSPGAVPAPGKLLEGLPTHADRGMTLNIPTDLCNAWVFNRGPKPGACCKWALKGASLVF